MRKLRDIFSEHREELSSDILDSRLELRVNNKEKELYKLYAKAKKTTLSNLVRSLLNDEIDKFIKM